MTNAAVYKQKLQDDFAKDNHEATHHFSTLEELSTRITIDRPVFKQRISDKSTKNIKALSNKNGCCNLQCKPKQFLKNTIPALSWIYSYNWKEWLIKDIIAGFTVAVMNIPQGMAYALLGNVPPIVGIYMAFFPVLVYVFLGTSRHISMGSFAVVCLMVGNVVVSHTHPVKVLGDINSNASVTIETGYSPLEVATAVTFLVGIYQIIMYILQLGIVCTLLSETLVSGFTAGAAVHVLSSQIKDILGLKLKQINGPFKLINVYIEIFSKVHTANIAATIISAITVIVLITNNEILKPFVARRTIFPIPIELIVVLAGTLISNYCNITEIYHLKTVGHIAVGLPSPVVPNFSVIPSVALDSAVIALIAYVISLSMALIFANKLKYEVNANQELLAQGCGNLVGSFFSCLPFAASLSRSVIQQTIGGVTQMASLVSCGILLAVLLWIGPFFELLPRCILASLIVVALKGILLQAKDIIQIMSVSKTDGIIWLSTYITVICVEIEYGLLIGIITSLLILIIKDARGNVSILGRVPDTELYLETNSDNKVELVLGITIIRYCGSLNFINKNYFEKQIMESVKKQPLLEINLNKVKPEVEKIKETIILDFQSLQYIDSSGGKMFKKIINTFSKDNVVYLVGLSGMVLKMLNSLDVLNEKSIVLMPTIHDAVISAQTLVKDGIYSVRL